MSRNDPSGSRNTNDTRAELDQLNRGQSNDVSRVVGYDGPGGEPRTWQGDDDSPFIKALPFTEEPVLWAFLSPLPTAAAGYTALPGIDVEDYRLLQVLFELQWGLNAHPTSQLSILPEHLAVSHYDPPEAWYATTVVNPTITLITPALQGDGYGSQVFSPSELRTPIMTAAVGVRTQRFCMQFDVSNVKTFRLKVLELAQGQNASQLAVAYQRSN
jgi:hypothetical protein